MRMAGRIGSRETGPKLSDASCTGPARWLCVDRVRQESGFGKAADRPPYDQKRTLEATNGTSQIDVKRSLLIALCVSQSGGKQTFLPPLRLHPGRGIGINFDLAGTAVFATSDALAAARARQTPLTFAFFAVVTGIGGKAD
jgi:hypothetical protein